MSEGAYRIEVASSGRAICRDALCKKNGIKIRKGELRFCTWVSSSNEDWSGFQYKHWGCVSGKILENLRNNLRREDPEGEYQWDYLDGLTDLDDELQSKVKTAIIEGKIADEDFNGDPAYNQLGKKGIRGRAPAPKANEDEGDDDTAVPATETPAKPSTKKRSRAKKESDDSAEEDVYRPTKNGRANKKAKKKDVTKEDEEKEVETGAIPKRARAKKLVTTGEDAAIEQEEKEEIDVDVKPTRKSRASKTAKKEDIGDKESEGFTKSNTKPVKKGRGRAVKKEPVEGEDANIEEHDQVDAEIKPAKSRGKRAATKENANTNLDEVKMEESNGISIDIKPAKKRRGKAAAIKEGDDDESNGINQVLENEVGGNLNLADEALVKETMVESDPVAKHNREGHGPVDPKERVQDGFVDKDGPLYRQFREWVEANECGNKWPEFLYKMQEKLANAGEIDEDDLDGCLDKMTELENAGKPLQDGLPKKSGGAKKKATKPRVRRSKA